MKEKYAQFLLNKTKIDYNRISNDFSRTRSSIWEETRFLFNKYIKKNDKVIDLGCGNGRYAGVLLEKGARYTGVDNSDVLIDLAVKKYPKADFKIANVLYLPFLSKTFDKAISIAVLHHIPSDELRLDFLNEVKRVLKDKGIIIITVWKFHMFNEYKLLLKYTFLKLIGKSKLDFKDIMEPWSNVTDRYYHWFSMGELEKLVKKAGFNVIEKGITINSKGNRKNYYVVAQK